MTKKERNNLKGKITRSREESYNSVEYCQTPNCNSHEFQKCHLLSEASKLKSIEEKGKVCWINPKPATLMFKDIKEKEKAIKVYKEIMQQYPSSYNYLNCNIEEIANGKMSNNFSLPEDNEDRMKWIPRPLFYDGKN